MEYPPPTSGDRARKRNKLFSDEVENATAPEKFTTSILMYRQIMFHDVGTVMSGQRHLFRIIIAR